jgi:hypothetical protein
MFSPVSDRLMGELGGWRSRVRDGEGRNDARSRGSSLFLTLELSAILLPSEVQRICVSRELIYNTNPEIRTSYTRLRLFQPLLQSPKQLAGVQDPKIAY